MYDEAVRLGISTGKLKDQLDSGLSSLEYFKQWRRCVFLSWDNLCRIQDSGKPKCCRDHAVISPPSQCYTDGTVLKVVSK